MTGEVGVEALATTANVSTHERHPRHQNPLAKPRPAAPLLESPGAVAGLAIMVVLVVLAIAAPPGRARTARRSSSATTSWRRPSRPRPSRSAPTISGATSSRG
ncbi:MAG: hypothetical protein WDN49_21880 [Acetobacteraceae bacterium]